jgi:hypothetical protein
MKASRAQLALSKVIQSAVKPPDTDACRPPSPLVTPQQTLAGAHQGVYPKYRMTTVLGATEA